ncbi:hypothetical protein EJ110_NYTH28778 [Nymphaea thermarum]|nr:hypothetical protein EJ110_NYTH28778 [Nymphaea thermarum]
MAENSKSEGPADYKMAGNSFSYGTTMKLNGSNYEIWSRVFIMSVAGHRKKYILEEDEPIEKKGIYAAWDEDNYIVMSWIMNSVESHIAPTIAYYTKAKDMWSFLRKTYLHATNVIKILQLEEELCNIRQGDQDLSQYFATLTAAYERLKALRPPCQHCYASHAETGMVAKFLSGLSSEYSVAKSQILTGSELPDLADTYNRLSRFAATRPYFPPSSPSSSEMHAPIPLPIPPMSLESFPSSQPRSHERFLEPPLVYTRRLGPSLNCPPASSQEVGSTDKIDSGLSDDYSVADLPIAIRKGKRHGLLL